MEHTYNDVYYEGTINVPFSWEYKPGLSKVMTPPQLPQNYGTIKLQPPPSHGLIKVEDAQISDLGRLCAVQTLLRTSSSRILESSTQKIKEEDPFVEAYKKCTKSPFILQQRQSSTRGHKNNGSWPSIRKYVHILSCKYSGDVISHKAAVYT